MDAGAKLHGGIVSPVETEVYWGDQQAREEREIVNMELIQKGKRTNEHGVTGEYRSTGHFGRWDEYGHFESNVPVFIPNCCLNCLHYYDGEFGDFRERLSPPDCFAGVYFPVRKGTCKRQKPIRINES